MEPYDGSDTLLQQLLVSIQFQDKKVRSTNIATRQAPMRSLTPGLFYIQPMERGLSGDMGVAIDSGNASIPGDDQFHANSGASLTFSNTDPYNVDRRWIDIFSQGTSSFRWNISTDPYVTVTQSSGTLSTHGNTDIRIYVSIDWDKVPGSSGTSRINIS